MESDSNPLLRVHSEDLVHHIAEAVGSSFESGCFSDLSLRCADGKTVHAHRLVMAAVSPYLKEVFRRGKLTLIVLVAQCA